MKTSYLPYLDKPNKWSSHSQIIQRLSLFERGARVLDVGTASGTIARMCQGQGLRFYGIEPNPTWAEKAQSFYESIQIATLETCPEEFARNYQVVILADVLEHLPRPEQSLQSLMKLQPDGSVFLISVPNIANIWIRLSLLLGKFDYTERGILDRTHLRFFTRKTLLQMLADLELRVDRVGVTPIPLEQVSPFFESSKVGRWIYAVLDIITNLFPTILGYQFVITAVKGKI